MIKSLWAMVQSPLFLRRFHGWMTLGWLVVTPVSWWLGWWDIVAFVTFLSLWANVASHWAAWAAARVEVRQEEAGE